MNGKNILIYRDGVTVAGTRSHDIGSECEVVPVSYPGIGKWRCVKAGRRGWSLTVNYLVLSDERMVDLLDVGKEYRISSMGRDADVGVQGMALCTSCRITSTTGNIVQRTFQFVGNGELKEREVMYLTAGGERLVDRDGNGFFVG